MGELISNLVRDLKVSAGATQCVHVYVCVCVCVREKRGRERERVRNSETSSPCAASTAIHSTASCCTAAFRKVIVAAHYYGSLKVLLLLLLPILSHVVPSVSLHVNQQLYVTCSETSSRTPVETNARTRTHAGAFISVHAFVPVRCQGR